MIDKLKSTTTEVQILSSVMSSYLSTNHAAHGSTITVERQIVQHVMDTITTINAACRFIQQNELCYERALHFAAHESQLAQYALRVAEQTQRILTIATDLFDERGDLLTPNIHTYNPLFHNSSHWSHGLCACDSQCFSQITEAIYSTSEDQHMANESQNRLGVMSFRSSVIAIAITLILGWYTAQQSNKQRVENKIQIDNLIETIRHERMDRIDLDHKSGKPSRDLKQ